MAIGKLFQRGNPQLTLAEAAAYDAPFPDARYKAGVRRFPNLVPDGADTPGVETSRRAARFWSTQWQGDSFMAVGMKDPVLGPPVMQALRQLIRGCPEPMQVAEGGHFVQEHGGPIAEAALRHFGLR
jgi:pimeloyl-ACP methyl ester carboxylesterase